MRMPSAPEMIQRELGFDGAVWCVITKFDVRACALADRHYNRRAVGAPQFLPPGQTLALITPNADAVFAWWRPHPDAGLAAMNGLDGWTCTIFRNEGPQRSSLLILAAERMLAERHDCGPDGLIIYVDTRRVRGPNPGYCFLCAGWHKTGWAKSGHKRLLQKPFDLAGQVGA